MSDYHHVQQGTFALVALGLSLLFTVAVGFSVGSAAAGILAAVIAAVLLLCLFLFRTLTVTVDGNRVTVWFGPGWIRRTINLAAIVDVRIVRNSWYNGWGIRAVPDGWMYNVSGFDAVELEFNDGRVFRIGTDDVENLHQAIVRARPGSG